MAPFDTDVFVLGGGPAGLAAAIAARAKGFAVTVADSATPPIDKACGEGLMPETVRAISELGIALTQDCGRPIRGIQFRSAHGATSAHFPTGDGLGVRRTVLHRILIDRAAEVGVCMRWGTPSTLR